jgi:hypothetical protein
MGPQVHGPSQVHGERLAVAHRTKKSQLHLPQEVAKQRAHTRISSALHKTKHKNM